MTTVDVLYFAWVRERIGLPRERVETAAATVAELVEELKAREDRYAAAFADVSTLRVALDQDPISRSACFISPIDSSYSFLASLSRPQCLKMR